MIRQLRQEPGIEAAGGALYFPCRPKLWLSTVWVEGANVEEGLEPIVYYNLIAGDYFRAMGIPLKKGRLPSEEEMWERREVVVVNEAMASQVFPNTDPLAKRFKTGKNGPWKTIIGVVGNVRQEGLDRRPKSEFYVPFSDMPMPFLTLVVNSPHGAHHAVAVIRKVTLQEDARLSLAEVAPLARLAERTVAHRYMAFLLLGLFAAIALSLAGIGIYGVVSYVVAQSTSELGVRMALGASRRQIVQLVTTKGMRSAAVGAVTGLLLALAAARPMSALLYEVSAFDPWIYVTVPVIALGAAAVACLLPALRASSTDPLTALRNE
jgi:predicted permease